MRMLEWSALPTSPTVARQVTSTRRISEDGMRRMAYLPSLPMSCTEVPAERAMAAPLPGWNSMAWTRVPTGISDSGRALPGLMSAPGPEMTVSPTLRPLGARM